CLGTPLDCRIIVKLIVPDHVEEGVVIDLVKSRAYWIRCCVARTTVSLLERRILAARVNVLLAIQSVILHFTAKQARSCCPAGAPRESGRIEFENEPPRNRVSIFQKRHGRSR